MSEQNDRLDPEPTTPDPAAEPAPVIPGRHTLRGKKWVFGATLAAAGLVAGSGATYVITTATTPSQSQAFADRGANGGPGGSGRGAPPNGTAPGGTGAGGSTTTG